MSPIFEQLQLDQQSGNPSSPIISYGGNAFLGDVGSLQSNNFSFKFFAKGWRLSSTGEVDIPYLFASIITVNQRSETPDIYIAARGTEIDGDQTKYGGSIFLVAGNGMSSTDDEGAGGSIAIYAGSASSGNNFGGDIQIVAGHAFGNNRGGTLELAGGGSGFGSGAGGDVSIIPGEGSDGTGNGGLLNLFMGGEKGSAGVHGYMAFCSPFTESVMKNEAESSTTTSATQKTLWSKTLAAGKVLHVEAFVAARRTGGSGGTDGDVAGYHFIATYKRDSSGGTTTLVGAVTAVHTAESQAAWDATFTISTNDVRLSVTGAANNNVTWQWFVRYLDGTILSP